jgi:hypothetical protein
MRDARTSKYVVTLDIRFSEQNAYGDVTNSGFLSYTTETKATDLGEIGAMLTRLQQALEKPQ